MVLSAFVLPHVSLFVAKYLILYIIELKLCGCFVIGVATPEIPY